MTTANISTTLEHLQQPQPLSILKLSKPILHPKEDSGNTTTPSMLAADLAHYRDLFSKLRFSYVEQVTKERFLRTICAEQPEFATAVENAELQTRLLVDKAQLKEKKTEVAEMISALEAQGRELAKRYEHIQLQTVQLAALPAQITDLNQTLLALHARQKEQQTALHSSSASSDPDLHLPSLSATRQRLSEREQELQRIDLEIARLQAALPAKQAETRRLEEELAPVWKSRDTAVELALEAKRRREEGGMAVDELEERGRWLRGVEGVMKGLELEA